MTLFYNLLLSHLISDFWFQSDVLCKQKQERRYKSWFLYVHAVVIGMLAYLLSNEYSTFCIWAVVIGVSHLCIDWAKSYITKHPLITFCADQLLHVIILYVVSYSYLSYIGSIGRNWKQFSFITGYYQLKIPTLLCAVVICCGMSNIIIKLVLDRFHIDQTTSNNNELNNAGDLIGNLERLICLPFVLLGRYEAIGFIIAAKSILRFRDSDHPKTEYVLAGSMLSLCIALICGLGLIFIWGHT